MLYLNDYDILTGNQLDRFVAHVKKFLKQGVAIDGLGVQGHLHGESFKREALQRHSIHWRSSICRFASLNSICRGNDQST